MPYVEETCEAGVTLEICRYHSYRHHAPGEKRATKENETSESQKKVNQRKAEKELRRLMNANFQDGDLLVRLDFFKEKRPPDSTAMQEAMKKMIRRLRTKCRKNHKELKYIYVKEAGSRGGRHVHMMMSKVDTDILREVWPYGGIHVDPLISNGQYAKIAAYFIKYAERTEKTEGKLLGKRWYGSRNLTKPKVRKRIISAKTFRREIRERKGYILDKDSVQSGISAITGYEYFSYTLIRTDKEGGGGIDGS